jgi:hypothetical protein
MVEEKERYRKSERAVLGCWGLVWGEGGDRESPAEGGTILPSQLLLPTWRKPILCAVHSTETLEDSDTFGGFRLRRDSSKFSLVSSLWHVRNTHLHAVLNS